MDARSKQLQDQLNSHRIDPEKPVLTAQLDLLVTRWLRTAHNTSEMLDMLLGLHDRAMQEELLYYIITLSVEDRLHAPNGYERERCLIDECLTEEVRSKIDSKINAATQIFRQSILAAMLRKKPPTAAREQAMTEK